MSYYIGKNKEKSTTIYLLQYVKSFTDFTINITPFIEK